MHLERDKRSHITIKRFPDVFWTHNKDMSLIALYCFTDREYIDKRKCIYERVFIVSFSYRSYEQCKLSFQGFGQM